MEYESLWEREEQSGHRLVDEAARPMGLEHLWAARYRRGERLTWQKGGTWQQTAVDGAVGVRLLRTQTFGLLESGPPAPVRVDLPLHKAFCPDRWPSPVRAYAAHLLDQAYELDYVLRLGISQGCRLLAMPLDGGWLLTDFIPVVPTRDPVAWRDLPKVLLDAGYRTA